MKTSSVGSLALAAAFAGLLGGTSARLNAQPIVGASAASSSSAPAQAGMVVTGQDKPALPKHACKGQNDCKGQGGGKHPGTNSCKGKGGCATDGSKPAKA